MPGTRVTMSDIAREAKVHQTTVSLALRNDPRLPEGTRQRLRALAERLGYKPDPMLSALNFYRASRHAVKAPPAMAYLRRVRSEPETDSAASAAYHPDDLFFKGAKKACERLGYRLVLFNVKGVAGEGERLTRILRSRGIGGVLLGSLDTRVGEVKLEWEAFSGLCIESQHLGLSLHTVGNDQKQVTRTAVKRAFSLGYRRVGLAVGEIEEAALRNPFTAGYLVEAYHTPGLVQIPPLILKFKGTSALAADLAGWVKRHRIDAVLSNWNTVPDLLRSQGVAIPQAVAVATLDHNPRIGAAAGMRQSHELVGERAVEALALLMKTNQKGPIELPNSTLIDGYWVDGPEMPPRAAKARKARR